MPPWSSGSMLDYRSLPPVFESRRGYIWRLFHLWLRFVTFGGRLAHLVYHVHTSGRKTSITNIKPHTWLKLPGKKSTTEFSIIYLFRLAYPSEVSFPSNHCWWILHCTHCTMSLSNPCTRCTTELNSFRGYWRYRSFVIIIITWLLITVLY